MRTIKVKYPFTTENFQERQKKLFEITKSLTKNETIKIVEVKHYPNVSIMISIAEKKTNEIIN